MYSYAHTCLLESCFWSCLTSAAVCCCCCVCCKPCLGNCKRNMQDERNTHGTSATSGNCRNVQVVLPCQRWQGRRRGTAEGRRASSVGSWPDFNSTVRTHGARLELTELLLSSFPETLHIPSCVTGITCVQPDTRDRASLCLSYLWRGQYSSCKSL